MGYLEVIGNVAGGRPGTTRRHRIRLDRLTDTGITDDSPTASVNDTPTAGIHATRETGSTHARDGCHPCAQTGVTHDTQTVIEPSLTVRVRASARDPRHQRLNGEHRLAAAQLRKKRKTPCPASLDVTDALYDWAQRECGFDVIAWTASRRSS